MATSLQARRRMSSFPSSGFLTIDSLPSSSLAESDWLSEPAGKCLLHYLPPLHTSVSVWVHMNPPESSEGWFTHHWFFFTDVLLWTSANLQMISCSRLAFRRDLQFFQTSTGFLFSTFDEIIKNNDKVFSPSRFPFLLYLQLNDPCHFPASFSQRCQTRNKL